MPSLSVAGRLPFDAFAAWALKLLLPLTGVLGLGLIWAGVASFFAHDLPGPVATWSVFSELVSHPFYDAGPNDKGIGLQLMASLQRDIEAGRPSEMDALIGALVRLGAEVGVETPLHAFLYGSLLPQERRARGQLQFPE